MSGMNGISSYGKGMPMNCGMKGMHGNEPSKAVKASQEKHEGKHKVSHEHHEHANNNGVGSKLDVKI